MAVRSSGRTRRPAGHNGAPTRGLAAARPLGNQSGRADAPSPRGRDSKLGAPTTSGRPPARGISPMAPSMRQGQTISVIVALLFSLAARAQDKQTAKGKKDTTPQVDHQHDFDWEVGDWKVHLRRLLHPLTGSKEWVEFGGTAHVRKVWKGGG